MSREFVHRMRVRFAECDPQSIVFNSRYLEYFDVGMTELWREAIGPYEQAMAELGVDLVVAEANLRFRSPLRFDDEFDLRLSVHRLGNSSMITGFAVVREGTTCVEGEMRHVCVDRGTADKREVPGEIREGLAPYLREH